MAERPPPTPDTIAAIATPPGRGGIGVIRVSGKKLPEFARGLRKSGPENPPARQAVLTGFYDAEGRCIDTGLLLYFPAPRSFTGEDVLEMHVHGGPVVLQMLLERCIELGARLAEPGEFTRRAYLNGKIDLAQAEAVIDLIDAATVAAARSAVRSLQGDFSREIQALLEQLTELRALLEATLDFPEEEIDFLSSDKALEHLEAIQEKLGHIFERARQGRRLQSGLCVVIAGRPNVGKSSLINRLAGDEIAIVTPAAGTTRDALHASMNVEGIPLHIIDTAGLRETGDEIEKIGIARAWKEIGQADVILLLIDAQNGLDAADSALAERFPKETPRLIIHNKIDLSNHPAGRRENGNNVEIFLSAKHGNGIDLLRRELLAIAGGVPEEDAFIARARHLEALEETFRHITAAREEWPRSELAAEELRLAQQALGRITGEFSADDLLGEIFGRFCIGK
ncbi:MAG: tRNA uridine-5-carboxymethylaminomethyl(34) synthesis GTPase MnmE [Candidatus Accumulibacter sp.]|nr:tRNA uridine-5-carboxymethylaminomethyl(34) synthesis GTPase MnmE [Accumulibacter sp.]